MYKIKDDIVVISPGVTIKDELDFLGMTQSEFSERMGFSEKHISKIINGEAVITPETAIKLEMVLGIPSSVWNNLESEYREQLFRIEELESLSEEVEYIASFPVKEILKKRWITLPKKYLDSELVIAFRKYFGVANMKSLQNVEKQVLSLSYRRNDEKEFCIFSMLTWIKQGQLLFRDIELDSFNESLLKQNIDKIKKLSQNNNENTIIEIKNLLKNCGIGLIILDHLPKTYVSGVTKWMGDKVMVIISSKGKKLDVFWFNLFHELGHILKHGKKKIYINDELETGNSSQEIEADEFSKNSLIPLKEYKKIIQNMKDLNLTQEYLLKKSKELEIHPSIIVGRLQHDKLIPYNSKFSKLRETMKGV
ncbi:MAG: HigA family addiction module antitoxin [Cetobacterium sp.]